MLRKHDDFEKDFDVFCNKGLIQTGMAVQGELNLLTTNKCDES